MDLWLHHVLWIWLNLIKIKKVFCTYLTMCQLQLPNVKLNVSVTVPPQMLAIILLVAQSSWLKA